MRNLALVLLAAISLLGVAPVLAAKCKIADNTEDLFAGVPIIRTKWDRISPNWEKSLEEYIGYVSASSEGEETYLHIRLRHLEPLRFKPTKDELANALRVPAGTELRVMMADNSVIALPAAELSVGETVVHSPYSKTYNTDDYIVITNADVKYAVDATAADELNAQDAAMFRLQSSSRSHDIQIHKKSLDAIKKALACVAPGNA
jgi:hypothetical protein